MLVLEADGFTAVVAEIRPDSIERAARITKHLGGVERVDLYLGAAVLTIGTEVLKPLKVSALALPVADLVFDKFERRRLAKVRNGEDRLEYRLEPDAVALLGDQVHLQESIIRLTLNLNEIRDLGRCINF